MPKQIRLLFSLLLFGSLAALPKVELANAQTRERPNVLFIFLDDYGWRDCGFMGSDFYETPHIDRLASEGMIFTDAYACASNCAPSRACLLSGQYTPRHEIYNVGTGLRGDRRFSRLQHIPGTDTLRSDIRTWADCIRDAGYTTGIIGKWHLSQDPVDYGFDTNIAGSHSGSPPRGYFPPHPNVPGLEAAADDEYLTDRLSDEALQFIDRNQQHPWLLYLSHFAVHTPLQAKPELIQKYEQKPAGELHSTPVMAAMIQSVDEGVGRLVAKLDELGLKEKTAIVFTSDNGGYGPATNMHPLKGYKGTYYEGGIREPFFVCWPGVVPAGTRCEVPVSNVDIFPTLCEITGASLPQQPLDGQSLLPLLTQSGTLPERGLFWHFPAYLDSYSRTDEQRDPLFRSRPCSIIRLGDWKLHEYFEDRPAQVAEAATRGDEFETDGLELYNLREDAGEANNLIHQERERGRELYRQLVAWREQTGAPVPREQNPHFDAMAESIASIKRTAITEPGQAGVVQAEFVYELEGRLTPECHASTIVETPQGLLAAWFGGTEEGHTDVGIWIANQRDGKWTQPRQVVDGSEGEDRDYPCWNPVLFQPQSGPLHLFYKVGPSPRMWWGCMITSTDNGSTWSEPRRLGTSPQLFAANQNLLGPVKNKPIQLEDGMIICPSSTENEGWRIHFETSRDLGASWQVVGPLLAGEELDAIQPSVLVHPEGRLQIVCRTKQGVLGTSWSSDRGASWGPMQSLPLPNPNSGTDAVTLSDGRHLLVYNHTQREGTKNGRQILNVAISPDGLKWEPILKLEHHNNAAGYSYPAVIQTTDGLVHITYTWRRQTIKHVVVDPRKLGMAALPVDK